MSYKIQFGILRIWKSIFDSLKCSIFSTLFWLEMEIEQKMDDGKKYQRVGSILNEGINVFVRHYLMWCRGSNWKTANVLRMFRCNFKCAWHRKKCSKVYFFYFFPHSFSLSVCYRCSSNPMSFSPINSSVLHTLSCFLFFTYCSFADGGDFSLLLTFLFALLKIMTESGTCILGYTVWNVRNCQ